jgi:hypothetical protein
MATETLPLGPGRARRTRPAPEHQPGRRPERGPERNRLKKPIGSPRHTRPLGTPAPSTTRGAARRGAAPPRAPFIVLLVGLLGGALISLLVISTTLDEGSYQINKLIQQNNALNRQRETLQLQVADSSAPGTIAREAASLGWKPDQHTRFLNTSTGTISDSAPVTAR